MNRTRVHAATLALILAVAVVGFAAPASAQAGVSTDVSITPPNQTVAPGSAVTYDIAVDSAPDGIDSYQYTVSTSDPSSATITDFSFGGSPATESVSYAADNSSVDVQGGFVGLSGGQAIVIGTVTVKGDSLGDSADIALSVTQLVDSNNNNIQIQNTNSATLSVTGAGPGDVTGDGNPATDPDGDGLYEDVTGDGTADATDVDALETYIDNGGSDLAFDFSEDGKLDLLDYRALKNELGVGGGGGNGGSSDRSVYFDPVEQTIPTGGTATYDLVIADAPDGVDSYDYTISTTDVSNATITDFEFAGNPAQDTADFASDSSSVDVVGGLAGLSAGTDVVLGTVTIEGVSEGSANVSVSVTQLVDGNNDNIAVSSVADGSVQVGITGPGDITGNGSPATDQDGDGRYEDINGDGDVNLQDLRPFFDYVSNSANQYAVGLDFNNDGQMGLRDLRPFFDTVTAN